MSVEHQCHAADETAKPALAMVGAIVHHRIGSTDMKITPTDLATLVEGIGELSPNATERQRWDALWVAVDSGKINWDILQPYQDAHIDTALRVIAKG